MFAVVNACEYKSPWYSVCVCMCVSMHVCNKCMSVYMIKNVCVCVCVCVCVLLQAIKA